MNRVLGIVNLHSNASLGEITKNRPIASTNLLGRYAFIDFALSNFANSGIADIGVLIKEKPRSLFRHMGMGKEWNLNTKVGSIMLLYNEQYANNTSYNHDINNLLENKWMLENTRSDYVIIAPCHMLSRIDYTKLVQFHENSGTDISIVYKKVNNAKEHFIGSSFVAIDNGYITGIKTNKGDYSERNIFMETYIMSVEKLRQVVDSALETSHFFTLKDIINLKAKEEKISAYEYTGYLRCFDSTASYLKYSLELLDQNVANELFDPSWPIFTRTYDSPPAKYCKEASVKNCYVSNGAIINGEIENCIIGRGVKIGKNTKIKNSIIFSSSVVEEGVNIENVIVDKEVRIKFVKEFAGTPEQPLVIKQGDVV
jgi:glucose-1-phosphate adenylyltransferase